MPCYKQYRKEWEKNRKTKPAKEHQYPEDFTKTCHICKTPKPKEDFARSRNRTDGLNARCRLCDAAWHKKRKARDPEKYLARANEVMKRLRKANPEKFKKRDKIFNRLKRLRNYHMTEEDFFARLFEQDGLCAICQDPLIVGPNTHIDHDHKCCASYSVSCGKCVRGLLCRPCNHGLGKFRDSPEYLRAAAAYLEEHPISSMSS